jgi:beta-1,4-mannosyl-glycoprotein beta-1,4-N-acetylglucosaminyltransferase
MIVDCFAFFNELELLELRLNTLDSVVDKFYLVESPYTFTGLEKPLYFEANKHRKEFAPFLDKIVHVITEGQPLGLLPNAYSLPEKQFNAWTYDHWQKDHFQNALKFMEDDDVFMFSDLDEIPNPFVLKELISKNSLPAVLLQTLYFYFINWIRPSDEDGSHQKEGYIYGTALITKSEYQRRGYWPQKFRDERFQFYKVPPERGGWHYCSLGGVDRVAHKTKSWAHVEVDCHGDLEETKLAVQKAVNLACDAYHNNIKMTVHPFYPERHPPYMSKLLSKFPYLANFDKS